jgi:hypothetical protein
MGLLSDRRDGTATVAGDYVLGAGWGGTTFTVTAGSTDDGGELVLTCVTGGGLAQATATIAFTFKDGAFPRAPVFIVTSTTDNALTEVGGWAQSNTTTIGTWTYGVLPVNAKIYKVRYKCVVGYK